MWEYSVEIVGFSVAEADAGKDAPTRGYTDLAATLKERGAESWELVSAVVHGIQTANGEPLFVLFWKRPM